MIRDARYCPECGCYISVSLEKCPACGYSDQSDKKDTQIETQIKSLYGNNYASQSTYETFLELSSYMTAGTARISSNLANIYASMGGNAATAACQAGANSMRTNLIKEIQQSHGLTPDGICGSQTQACIIMASEQDVLSAEQKEGAIYHSRDTGNTYVSVDGTLVQVASFK